jgi:hypothetical protein
MSSSHVDDCLKTTHPEIKQNAAKEKNAVFITSLSKKHISVAQKITKGMCFLECGDKQSRKACAAPLFGKRRRTEYRLPPHSKAIQPLLLSASAGKSYPPVYSRGTDH